MTQIPAAQDTLRAAERALAALEAQLKELDERIAKIEAEIKAIDAKAMKGAKANVERRAELADKLSALQAQRNPETGKAERSTALEQRVNRDLKAITASETAQVKTADKIVLTAAQVRLLKELDATFETYAAMRKGILSYIATAQ